MGKALCLIGFLGFFACNIWLIINNVKNQNKKPCVLSMTMSVVLFIAGISMIPAKNSLITNSTPTINPESDEVETLDSEISTEKNTFISKQNFDKIEKGITYNEVKKIVGSDGKAYYESGDKNTDSYIVNYEWRGDNAFSVALITCKGKNQKVVSMSQGGLT